MHSNTHLYYTTLHCITLQVHTYIHMYFCLYMCVYLTAHACTHTYTRGPCMVQLGPLQASSGCQNYGLLLGPLHTRSRIAFRTQNGTIILTTTQVSNGQALQLQGCCGVGSAKGALLELGMHIEVHVYAIIYKYIHTYIYICTHTLSSLYHFALYIHIQLQIYDIHNIYI